MEKVAIINNIARIITESSTSSESDSDSEMEEILTILIKNRTNNIPRMRCKKYMDVVSQYTDKEFKSHFRYIFIIFVCTYFCVYLYVLLKYIYFRLHRNTFYFILDLIGPILERNGNSGRRTISSEKQLLVALWIMATPNSYR